MRGSIIKMIKILLQVLSMITLRIGKTEKPLLKDGIMTIPKGRREAKSAVAVTNAEQTILAPAINP
jgi:hypothetical protein